MTVALSQFTISFREGFEAALVVAVIVAYLNRTRRSRFIKYVWYGVLAAAAASLAAGLVVATTYGALPEGHKNLFESIASLLAVAVLSSVVYWMAEKGPRFREEIEASVEEKISERDLLGLSTTSFILVFREGFETVLFLAPFYARDPTLTLVGASGGLAASAALSYLVFLAGVKISIRRYFYFTSLLLVSIASGLLGYGVHELIEYLSEAGVEVGWLGRKAYDLGIPPEHPLHPKNPLGSVLAALLGYSASAEWGRVIAQLLYLALAIPLTVRAYRKRRR